MNVHPTYEVVSTLHLPTQGDPTVVAIDPEGSLIAVGTADGHVLVWCLLSYELLCQTSPPPNECGLTGTQVTNMTWMPNGLLAFARRNGLMGMLLVGKQFIEAVSIAVHDHLPVLAMAYSDTLSLWATATYNEIGFIRWKRSDWHTFDIHPEDRIIAKRVAVSSEEERPVTVTSLNWIKKSATVAYLVVSFLHHHVEIIDGRTRNVLTHVAIHTPVCRLTLSPDQTRALVTNTARGLVIYDLPSAHVIACARDVQGLNQDSPATFAHGGHAILVGCEGGQAKIFDAGSMVCLQTLNHEGCGDIIAIATHAFEDLDRFVVGTAVSGNKHAAIFIWQTIGRDLKPSQSTNVIPWIWILRVALAWAILIGIVLTGNRGHDGASWVPGSRLDKCETVAELQRKVRSLLDKNCDNCV